MVIKCTTSMIVPCVVSLYFLLPSTYKIFCWRGGGGGGVSGDNKLMHVKQIVSGGPQKHFEKKS